MTDNDELLSIAVEASTVAGDVIRQRFQKISSVRYKGRANPVTDVDLLAEEMIVETITRRFPEHNILSEEVHTVDRDSEYTWIIDPLDGTMNFTMGIPFVAVSVALAVGDTPLLGAVYDPIRKETFTAERGKGAFLNRKPITVSKKQSLNDAVIGVDLGYDDLGRRRAVETILLVRPQVQAVRLLGSAVLGLCYAACGRFDVYFHPHVYPWDISVGALLIAEAGGQVTDLHGSDVSTRTSNIAASNHRLHKQFMDLAAAHLIAE